MKIDQFDENSSLWWKFIIVMQYDFGWNYQKVENSWLRQKILYDKCYLLGRSWCNPSLMKNYGLNKNPSLWGKFMLFNLDVRSTL